jgi:hypothetical protein
VTDRYTITIDRYTYSRGGETGVEFRIQGVVDGREVYPAGLRATAETVGREVERMVGWCEKLRHGGC